MNRMLCYGVSLSFLLQQKFKKRQSYKYKTRLESLLKKSKIIFDINDMKSDLKLEEIIALITTGERNSQEYGLTVIILKNLTSKNHFMTKSQMYDLYMRNRESISKASFYRILNRLIERGMIIFNEKEEKYQTSILFSNSLQRLALAWEKIVLGEKI